MSHPRIRVSPRLVGRHRERAWLEACWRDAVSGSPRVVLVSGEPGIGKSRLIRELRAVALRDEATVCTGRAYEDLAQPFLPVAEALEPLLARNADGPQRELEALRQLRSPPRADPAPAPASDDLDAAPAGEAPLFRSASRALVRLARRQPTCLLLDDLHWADAPTLELIRHLVYALADAEGEGPLPFLLVCGYRTGEKPSRVDPVLARVRHEEICSEVALDRLDDAEVVSLLSALGVPRPSARVLAVVETAQGNPLFVQELIRHLDRYGLLRERQGSLDLPWRHLPLDLPPTLEEAIAWRTRDLGAACRRALIPAAALGHRFRLEDLRELIGDEPPLVDLLEEAVGQGLLCAEGDAFEFVHPLLREAVYAQAPAAHRREIHLRIADAFEGHPDADARLLEIAHHLRLAGDDADPERLAACARRAGERALALCAHAEGARHFEAALDADAARGANEPRSSAELHYRAGLAFFRAGDAEPCVAHLEAAARDYRRLGDRRGLAQALMVLARTRVTIDPLPYGTLADVGALREARAALGPEDRDLRGRIAAILSEVHWVARQPEAAAAMAREALAIGRETADDWLCSEACDALALAHTQTCHLREAAASQRLATDYARRHGDRWIRVQASRRLPLILAWLGEIDEAERVAHEAAEGPLHGDDGSARSMALAALAAIAASRGRFDEAEATARDALGGARRSGNPWGAFNALMALACARGLRGAWVEARETLAQLVEPGVLFEEPGAPIRFLVWLHEQLLDVRARPTAGSRDALAAAIASVVPDGEPEVGALSGLCAVIEIADWLEAPALVAAPSRLLSMAFERGAIFASAWPSLVPRVLGVAAGLRGAWAEAEERFDAALAAARRLELPVEEARVHLDHARMLARRSAAGDGARIRTDLGRAAPLLAALELRAFARPAELLAERFGPAETGAAEDGRPELGPDDTGLLASLAAVRSLPERAGDARLARALARIGADALAGGLPRSGGPTVLLLTDMVGSTELIELLGDRGAREVMHLHNAILREQLRAHGGREIEHTGDGILAGFEAASRALACAVAIQRAFVRDERTRTGPAIRVRIALAAGEPLAEDGGRVFGSVVNTVARVCALAEPGEILVADAVARLAVDRSLAFEERAPVHLKGFSRPFHLRAVRW
jgi:class 3 adenylate cyclase/tetratricopeptide (TPR) repeat protein